nr:coiled-coil domain-containing protein 97 [Leptinotarsa decemlineata]
MSMEVETDHERADEAEEAAVAGEENIDWEKDEIISFLTYNQEICFKNQQRWEADLTIHEKYEIALKLLKENKLQFLMKFGKYLKQNQLGYFEQFTKNFEPDSIEIKVVLDDLYESSSEKNSCKKVKNRRFEALKEMVEKKSYFSEIEMMKRNPLLYEQLVGQYMTADEVKERDKYVEGEQTLVTILMEGIERQDVELSRKKQEEIEDSQMEEEEEEDTPDESDSRPPTPIPSTSRWGEFEEDKVYRPKPKSKPNYVSATEKILLQKEFVSSMYQSFLDGKDKEFDYETVDNNSLYDNIKEMDNDAEEKYFATDDVEDNEHVEDNVESSEDELDIYMNALNQHPTVCQLSNDMKKL